jgi:hypothetical protein
MNILSKDSKKILIEAYVLSVIKYSLISWMHPTHYKLVERIIRQCGRFIYSLSKYDSVKMIITNELKWLFPKHCHKYELLKLCFLSTRNIVPEYFMNYLVSTNTESIKTRSRSYPNEPFPTQSSYGKKAVKFMASKAWNDFLLNTPDFDVNMSYIYFKTFLHDLLLQVQNNDLLAFDSEHANCDFSCIESAIRLA